MEAIDRLRERLPPFARDIQLNLSSVLQGGALDDDQRWGVAVACAVAVGDPALREAVCLDAATKVGEAVLDDARAAAALMAMNNVYYRFRHMVGKDSLQRKARPPSHEPARPAQNRQGDLRAHVPGGERDQRLEACIQSHEHAVLEGGLTEDHVMDAVRIAATMRAAAVALQK